MHPCTCPKALIKPVTAKNALIYIIMLPAAVDLPGSVGAANPVAKLQPLGLRTATGGLL